MSFEVRGLYPAVGRSRPDVPEAHVWVSLQEAVRVVCRETKLARAWTTATLSAGAAFQALTVDAQMVSPHDVLLSDGTRLADTSMPFMRLLAPTTGTVRRWGFDGKYLWVHPTPSESTALTIEYSYVPSADVDTAPLPESAAQAVTAYAESLMLDLPGSGRDSARAEQRRAEAMGHMQAAYKAETGRPA